MSGRSTSQSPTSASSATVWGRTALARLLGRRGPLSQAGVSQRRGQPEGGEQVRCFESGDVGEPAVLDGEHGDREGQEEGLARATQVTCGRGLAVGGGREHSPSPERGHAFAKRRGHVGAPVRYAAPTNSYWR